MVAEFGAENPKDVASVALMAPAGLGKGGVVNPVLLLPVIGDWVFRVLGAEVVTLQMATAYAGSPDQRAMLDWMDGQSKYRGFAEGILNSLRHDNFEWRPDVYQAFGRSGYVPQAKLLTRAGSGHAITHGRAENVLNGYTQFLDGSTRC